MKERIVHIIYRTLGIAIMLFAVARVDAQIVVQECDTMVFSVVSRPSIPEAHYVWGIYPASPNPTDVLDPAGTLDPALYFVDGMYASGEGKTVKVANLPPGNYYVRIHVWDDVNCTDNLEMHLMEVTEKQIDFELSATPVCIGEATTVRIIFSGIGPYTIHYVVGDELTPSVFNLNGQVEGPDISIPISQILPAGETTFWIMKIEDGVCKSYEYTGDERPNTGIVIYPKPTNSQIYLKDD